MGALYPRTKVSSGCNVRTSPAPVEDQVNLPGISKSRSGFKHSWSGFVATLLFCRKKHLSSFNARLYFSMLFGISIMVGLIMVAYSYIIDIGENAF